MICPEKPPFSIAYITFVTVSGRKLKFGPFVRTRFCTELADPSAPTTDSVWHPEQWSRNSTAPAW